MNDQYGRRANERGSSGRGDHEGGASGRGDYEYDQRGRRPMYEPTSEFQNESRRELGSGSDGRERDGRAGVGGSSTYGSEGGGGWDGSRLGNRTEENDDRERGGEWGRSGVAYSGERGRPSDRSFSGPVTWRGYGSGQGGYGYGGGSFGRSGPSRSSSYESGEGADYGRQSYGGRYGIGETGQRRGGSLGGSHQSTGRFAGKGPKGYTRSDERIKEQVSEKLEEHGDIDASEITVQVKNGEVTLEGTLSDRSMKRMAEDVAEDCPGVKEVQNRLRVEHGNGSEKSSSSQGSEKSRSRSNV